MPLYEYCCSEGHQYDLQQGFDAAAEHQCMEAPKGIRCTAMAKRMPVVPLAAWTRRYSDWKRKAGTPSPQEEGFLKVSDTVKQGSEELHLDGLED